MLDKIPPELREAMPGFIGALIAFFRTNSLLVARATVFVIGCAVSYWGSGFIAQWLGVSAVGLVGFFLGLFSPALVEKFFDVIKAINPSDIWQDFRDWLKRKGG